MDSSCPVGVPQPGDQPHGKPHDKHGRLKRLLRHVPALLGVLLLLGAIFVVQHEFRHLKFADISRSLHAIPARALVISLVWTVLAYGVLTFYDRLATIYANNPVSYARVAFASFCAYTLSHNLGMPAVSGAAVRYRLYANWGLQPLQIAKVVAFCSLTFGLGGMTLGGTILFFEPGAVPFFGERLPHWAMYLVGSGLLALAASYVVLASLYPRARLFGHEIELPGWRMAVLQVGLASLDVAVTAAIFYALLPNAPGLTYPRFLAIYLASYTAGLATNIPGGIGVFDSAMLLGLAPFVSAPEVVGAIVVFRLYYYIIPLFLAGGLFTGNELLLRGGTLFRRGKPARVSQTLRRYSEPDFAIGAATGVVALCGALLLTVAVLVPQPDFSWIDPDFGEMARSAGQFVPSLIGAGLLVLSIGLSQRVTLAWGSTLVLLLAAATFTAAQGELLWLPAILVIAALLIAPFRSAFYRHAWVMRGPLQASNLVPLAALLVCILALGLFDRHVRHMTENSWWELVLSRDLPNSLRVTMGLTVAVALFAIWRLIRPSHVSYLPWNTETRLRYARLGRIPPVRADGLVMGEAERAALPFRRLDGVLLGLGDPVGAESDCASAIWRLRDLATQEGLDAAVWNAGPYLLKIYIDLGLTVLPLDRDGMPTANVPGEVPRGYLCCVAERDLHRLLPILPELAGRHVEAAE
jgi:uncharacterized membrane protein YbhN (UPF0104 family)